MALHQSQNTSLLTVMKNGGLNSKKILQGRHFSLNTLQNGFADCKMVLQTAKHHGVSFLQYKSCLKEILQKPRLFEQQKSALAHNAVKAKRESAFAAVKNI